MGFVTYFFLVIQSLTCQKNFSWWYRCVQRNLYFLNIDYSSSFSFAHIHIIKVLYKFFLIKIFSFFLFIASCNVHYVTCKPVYCFHSTPHNSIFLFDISYVMVVQTWQSFSWNQVHYLNLFWSFLCPSWSAALSIISF